MERLTYKSCMGDFGSTKNLRVISQRNALCEMP